MLYKQSMDEQNEATVLHMQSLNEHYVSMPIDLNMCLFVHMSALEECRWRVWMPSE